MNSNYDASMSFQFKNSGLLYSYNGKTNEVTGQTINDSIKYTPTRVNQCLQTGEWQVVPAKEKFPRAGIYVKVDTNVKAFLVGPSTQTGYWVVEVDGGSVFKVRVGQLKELQDDDTKAFAIARDLNIAFNTAMQMVKKGYGKL
jgi:hypothetical protein